MAAISNSSKWEGRLLPVNVGGFSRHIHTDTFTKPHYVFFRATKRICHTQNVIYCCGAAVCALKTPLWTLQHLELI